MFCKYCHTTINLYRTYTYTRKDGTKNSQYICRPCNTEKCKQYRINENGKAAIRRAVAKYEGAHPERRLAWSSANTIKLKPCVVCGKQDNIHRHHPDPLERMNIVFLCPLHHKEAHADILKRIK